MKRFLSPAILILTLSAFTSCAHIRQTREEYAVTGDDPVINGARLTSELITTDGRVRYSLSAMVYFMAGENETGPYKCLFTAWGKRGVHRSMTVERLMIRTPSGRSVNVPRSEPLAFAAGAHDAGWQATYVVPGVLELDYEEDGAVTMEATVNVRTNRRSVRKSISFDLTPTPQKETKFATVLDAFKDDDDTQSPSTE